MKCYHAANLGGQKERERNKHEMLDHSNTTTGITTLHTLIANLLISLTLHPQHSVVS